MNRHIAQKEVTGLAFASPFAFLLKVIFSVLLVSMTVPALATEEADRIFSAGVRAAKSGDYEAAIDHFRHARRLGKRSDALFYNLGVCFYRLQDYNAAITWFELLLRSPSSRGLALYNLGLAHRQLDQKVQAVRWFKRVLKSDADKKIKALAAREIRSLYSEKKAAIKAERIQQRKLHTKRWHAGARFHIGTDDNIIYPETEVSNGEGDNFSRYFAWGRLRLLGDKRAGVRARVLAYGTRYANAGDYDREFLQANLAPYWRWNTWSYELSVGKESSELGSEAYLSIKKYAFSARKYIKRGSSAVLKYGFDEIDDASNGIYTHLEGDRQYLGFHYYNYYGSNQNLRYKLNYTVEKNNRGDRLLDDRYFFSYSPFRQSLALQWEQSWWAKIKTWQGIAYRYSQYRDENVFQENGIEETRQREDEKLSLELGLGFEFTDNIELELEYRHHENDSNIDYYEYEQDLLTLGLNVRL